MKPTIGRIVIYKVNPDSGHDTFHNNGASEVPAIVVRVFDDGKINIRLFADGEGHPPWRTSVEQGDGPGQWQWPARA